MLRAEAGLGPTCNLSSWEAEVGGLGVGDQSELQSRTPPQLTTSEEAKGCGHSSEIECVPSMQESPSNLTGLRGTDFPLRVSCVTAEGWGHKPMELPSGPRKRVLI